MAGKEDSTAVETNLTTEVSDSTASLQIPLEEHRQRPCRRHAGAGAKLSLPRTACDVSL